VAGFRPGFGRGGMTHSFLVMMAGVGSPATGAMEAILVTITDLIASCGGAGVRAAGEEAMSLNRRRSSLRGRVEYHHLMEWIPAKQSVGSWKRSLDLAEEEEGECCGIGGRRKKPVTAGSEFYLIY
jgi:hypothetical protein